MKNQTCQNIIQKFKEELSFILNEPSDIINKTEKACGLCSAVLIEMKEIIKKNDFQSEKEEIHFFKKIKPQVYSKLIFYHTLFKIETKRPKTKLLQEKYLKRVLKKLHKYFRLNEDVCQYYWSEKEYNDELYFLRKNRNIALPTDTLFSFIDHEFSTLYDHTYSCIMAHEQLIRYLEHEIQKLQNQESKPELAETNYTWTDSKIALVELIYALHSSRSINNGKVVIKELVGLFEKLFHIDLEEYSRTFIDIRMRKTGQTKFLDNLKQSLLKRIEDADD